MTSTLDAFTLLASGLRGRDPRTGHLINSRVGLLHAHSSGTSVRLAELVHGGWALEGQAMLDPDASSLLSLVLAWFLGPACLLTELGALGGLLAAKDAGIDRLPRLWLLACVLVISPFRYLVLLQLLVTVHAVQSFQAFTITFVLLAYLPIIGLVLLGVGVVLPVLLAGAICGAGGHGTRARTIAACAVLPIACAAGHAAVFMLLPVVGWSISWVPADEVMRAVNGPAAIYYGIVVEPDVPRLGPRLYRATEGTASDRLRSHLSETYLSARSRAKWRFARSMFRARSAIEMANRSGEIAHLSEAEGHAIAELFRSALDEANRVDLVVLEASDRRLKQGFADLYLRGLESVSIGFESRSVTAIVQGQRLLNQWRSLLEEKLHTVGDND